MRSAAALHDDAKPSNRNAAHNSQFAKVSVLAARMMAPRPSSLMMARVLPPLAVASRAKRETSSGVSRRLQTFECGAGAGFAFNAADIAGELGEAARFFHLNHVARDARHKRGIEAAGAPRDLEKCERRPAPGRLRRAWRRFPP